MTTNLVVWYRDFSDYNRPSPSVLVRVIDEKHVEGILDGKRYERHSYTELEPVHPMYIKNAIKALESQQLQIARDLAALKSLIVLPTEHRL